MNSCRFKLLLTFVSFFALSIQFILCAILGASAVAGAGQYNVNSADHLLCRSCLLSGAAEEAVWVGQASSIDGSNLQCGVWQWHGKRQISELLEQTGGRG